MWLAVSSLKRARRHGALTWPACLLLLTSPLTLHWQNDDPNGSHISIDIVSSLFEGKNKVKRSQMVYKAIWEEMDAVNGCVHAVDQMTCRTPDEAFQSHR